MEPLSENLARYQRQIIYPAFGADGQRALGAASALIVGVGGLGSWAAELLARAGVGALRLVDFDSVELMNLHRQAMYEESDAQNPRYKVAVAARKIARINHAVAVETAAERVTAQNIEKLARGVTLILDGTDNFATRFVLNDYCVKAGLPWIFAGVVGAEAQVMTVIPGKTACLRCIYDSPAPPCVDPTCRAAGVLGPAVAAVAAMQAMEAIKILAGKADQVSPYLTKFDFWTNALQRIDTTAAARNLDCPCCKRRQFDYLEA